MLYADDIFKRAASLPENMTVTLRGHHLILLYGMMMEKGRGEASYSSKKARLVRVAQEDGHTKRHGENIVAVLEQALEPGEHIRLIDTLDDICETCDRKGRRECREFIPYDFSTSCEDRSVLHFYGLEKRTYTSRFVQKRIKERGIF